jgi:hypothetical protein
MGYYTYFKLEIAGDIPEVVYEETCDKCGHTVTKKVAEDKEVLNRAFDFLDTMPYYAHSSSRGYISSKLGTGGESTKWYDFIEHMKALSDHMPEFTFVLTGDGEERGDYWRMWFKGGTILKQWKAEAPDVNDF